MKNIFANKRNVKSILVSLVFFPAVMLGHMAGYFFGYTGNWLITSSMIPDTPVWYVFLSVSITQGIFAGLLSSYTTILIYRDYRFKSTMILPTIFYLLMLLMLLFLLFFRYESFIGNQVNFYYGNYIAIILPFFFYFIILKNYEN